MIRRRLLVVGAVLAAATVGAAARQQAPLDSPPLKAAIDALGSFDLKARTDAARVVRRAPASDAIPLLAEAVRAHRDDYVRYRALVLLSGFGEAAVANAVRSVVGDRDDRLRTVAFEWLADHPDSQLLPRLLQALPTETSEFVRPALTRAVAAQGGDPRARNAMLPLIVRGEDLFRGAVIGALGEYRATYAVEPILEVAKLDGPLTDDAITALGKIGGADVTVALTKIRESADPTLRPTVSAALCLLGADCPAHEAYIRATLVHAAGPDGDPGIFESAAHSLAILGANGREEALKALLDIAPVIQPGVRDTLALNVGLIALRKPLMFLGVAERRPDTRDKDIELVLEAFDILSEDYTEERFYVEIRRAYWDAPEGSERRAVAERLLNQLEFL